MKTDNIANVREAGAVGNGVADDTDAFQKAFFSGHANTFIPAGNYRISKTLRVPSRTHVVADAAARIFHCGDTPKKRGDFLLTNSDHGKGNEDITIEGGIWDGNNTGKFNTKDPDLFNENAWSGTMLNFFNVRRLRLENMHLWNSVVYYTRFSKISDFVIRRIAFYSKEFGFNQDGLHFGGEVRDGLIEDIRAENGQTNDDLLALNADDTVVRLENRDLLCGPIENLTFKNIYAENCYTAIRFLSINSPIRNIHIENINVGCRHFAINLDAARYCRTPLLREEDFPEGAGCIENVEIDGMTAFASGSQSERALIDCETRVRNFRIHNFLRDMGKDADRSLPTFIAQNVKFLKIRAAGTDGDFLANLNDKKDSCRIDVPFSTLELN
ncbi:MAG: glycosyl hydrolase family 28-related protein [Lentisphaerota bacterium]